MRTAFLFLLLLVSTQSWAQEGRIIFSGTTDRVDGPAPASVTTLVPMMTSGDFTFLGGAMLPDKPLEMLQRKQIQEELDLSDDQIAVVKELQSDINRQMGEIFAKRAEFGGDAGSMVEAASKAIRKTIERELTEILSPRQMKRLGQLEVQMKIRNLGARALTHDKLAEALDIDDDQKSDIKKQSGEMQKELQEEIEKLRERFRTRLIKDLLSRDQLVKLEELSGDEYEVKRPNVRHWQPIGN